MLPHDLPPWAAVYQQTQRWLQAGVFEAIVEDLRVVLRVAQGGGGQPSAVDSGQSHATIESREGPAQAMMAPNASGQ